MNNQSTKGITMSTTQEKMSWTKEIVKGKMTKRINVEAVTGGFITTITKYGYESDDKDAKYIDESEKFVSDYNPLDEEEEKEETKSENSLKDKVTAALNAAGASGDMMSV